MRNLMGQQAQNQAAATTAMAQVAATTAVAAAAKVSAVVALVEVPTGNIVVERERPIHMLVKQFLKLNPPRFIGTGDPETASLWIQGLEKALALLMCTEAKKVILDVWVLNPKALGSQPQEVLVKPRCPGRARKPNKKLEALVELGGPSRVKTTVNELASMLAWKSLVNFGAAVMLGEIGFPLAYVENFALLQPLPMNGSIFAWLFLAISMISICSNDARASDSAQCLSVDQRSLLLELRNSLVFVPSKSSKLVRWDRTAGSWSGVTCEDGLVVSLDLSTSRSLEESTIPRIPVELSRLTKLRTLDFTGNDDDPFASPLRLEKPSLRSLIGDMGELRELYLDGVIVFAEASEWCDTLSSSVPKLEVLSMSDCLLSDPINVSLMSLANLSVIQLDGNVNSFTTVPSFLANFSSLKTLSLRRLPDSIGNLNKLSRLDLSDCGLSGSIPGSMENLSKLTYLDLSSNNLTGSVPPYGASRNLTHIILAENALAGQIVSVGWEDLLNLEILDLCNNSLEGDIPPTLFTLPRLKMILLSNNRFNGELIIYPNVSLYQLGTLDLGSNLLRGSIPASIFELQGLTYLSLSSNNFSGSMNINVLQGSGNLTYMDLSYNGLFINTLASDSTAASSFPKFNTLKLASCQLRTLPRFLANQSKLVSLEFSENYIQGEIPPWIWTLENLSHLNLSSNFFEDLETPWLNITMSVVDLHSNKLRGNMPSLRLLYRHYLDSNLPVGRPESSMTFFSLSKNNFHGSIPESICIARYLDVLDLSHNHLDGSIPECLMAGSINVLNLRNNQLNGSIPQFISPACTIKTLDVSENLLEGEIPLSLVNCTQLEIVNIGDNQIYGTFPCHLKAISNLRVLVLRSNKFHGEIECLCSPYTWQMLQIIDLSSNNFSGILPASLLASWEAMKANVDFDHLKYQPEGGSGIYYQDTMSVTVKGQKLELVKILTFFTSIDFSGNRLDGPIPDTLGDLKALYFLNLSHNAISGSIPPVLGNLNHLESLDLSGNYFNGTIPACSRQPRHKPPSDT
ncbi:receptor-like protein 7 [Eucalyptus grandis]|uniref:receptor-like protein 7 n=1 Tax=Eucalyptus grandis TaxID=71139 RepID=UPI00192EF778|nr:receptor-like protein 7 [Eucalyptus grandis]